MFKTILALSLLCAIPSLAHAKAFKLGDDEPVTWITIPDTWEPETYDDGVEGTSADKETYVAAEIVAGNELDEAGKEEDKFFAKQKIKLKDETKKEKKTTVNGLPAYDISWDATDADGPTHVSLTLVKVSDTKLLLLTYWGSAAGEKSNGADLAEIAKSIKPIK
jgi:hypothetical protein